MDKGCSERRDREVEKLLSPSKVQLLRPNKRATPEGGSNTKMQPKNTFCTSSEGKDNKLSFLDALIENDIERINSLKHYSETTYGTDQSPALIIAAVSCSGKVIEAMIKNGANPRCVDNKGRVPILVAAASGNLDCLQTLLDNKVEAHYSFFGKPPLPMSLIPETEEAQKMEAEDSLMDQKSFKLPLPQVNYRTALHEAALNGNAECVKLLVNKMAQVNFGDYEGNTALHLAIGIDDVNDDRTFRKGSDDCIRALLNGSANLCALNKSGHSPLDLLLKKDCACEQIKFLSTYFYEQMSLCKDSDTNEKYILLNFKSLCPKGENEQTMVIYKLMETLDRDSRRKLFKHPLLRAFVRYKWLSIRSVFYLYVGLFILYVFSISSFVTLAHCDVFYVFGYGWRFKTAQNGIPIASAILLLTSILVGVNFIGLSYVFKNTYRWKLPMLRNMIGVIFTIIVSLSTIYDVSSTAESTAVDSATITPTHINDILSTSGSFSEEIVDPTTQGTTVPTHENQTDQRIIAAGLFSNSPSWVINITAIAVFLAWLELMLLVGRFPKWAAHALLFGPVLQNVLRIFVAYGCLIIGFAFAFFLLFRKADSDSFGDPVRSLMKTIVMMTGEIDYMELFNDSKGSVWNPSSLPLMARLAFLCFVITATIALMNLMLALAVSDTQELIRLSQENQLMQLAHAVIHWGYLIESIEESRYTPRVVKDLLRRKFYMPVKLHYYHEKSKLFPSDLRKVLKSVATRKSSDVSTEHWNKVENLFCAIMDLLEYDNHANHDISILRTHFGMLHKMRENNSHL